MVASRPRRVAIHCLVGDIKPPAAGEAVESAPRRFPGKLRTSPFIIEQVRDHGPALPRLLDGFPGHAMEPRLTLMRLSPDAARIVAFRLSGRMEAPASVVNRQVHL